MRPSAGLTLLELLIVLAIMGLLAVLAAPVMSGANDRLALRAAAERIAGDLAAIRDSARTRGRDVSVAVSGTNAIESAVRDGDLRLSLPEGIAATWMPDIGSRAAGLVFYADGSATGGVLLVQKGDAETRLRIHWLVGAVHVE